MKVLKWLDRYGEEVLISLLLAVIVLLMTIQVIMRYCFSNSLSWSEELSRYLFIWFTFLGISYSIRYNLHLKVDIIYNLLPKYRPYLMAISDFLFLVYLLYMIEPGFRMLNTLKNTGQTSTAIKIPIYIVYASLLTGYLLAILRLAQKYLQKYKEGRQSDGEMTKS